MTQAPEVSLDDLSDDELTAFVRRLVAHPVLGPANHSFMLLRLCARLGAANERAERAKSDLDKLRSEIAVREDQT